MWVPQKLSFLLELSASNDLVGFKSAIEEGCSDIDEPSLWYGRRIGSRKMGFEERTPLLIASLFGSKNVLLITNSLDANGNRPIDLSTPARNLTFSLKKKILESLLKGSPCDGEIEDNKSDMYGTDEFRMYNFKVTPCSRAYSHDWTECPFVHPMENERRRDPRKDIYSCVPCPEFRKGPCKQGDNCSAMHSPRSYSAIDSSLDMGSMSPHGLGSPSLLLPSTSTPPLTPTGSTSSPMAGVMWPSQSNTVPSLQPHGSRLKTARCVRNMDLDKEQLGSERCHRSQTQRLIDEIPGISLDTSTHHLQSPTGVSYMTNLPSYPSKASQSFGVEPSRSTGGTILSQMPAAFANQSPRFIELTTVNHYSGFSSPSVVSSNFSNSPVGKLDWGIQGEELNKLTQASSFAFRSSSSNLGDPTQSMSSISDEPNVSWIQSLEKDMDTLSEKLKFENEQ
ncbi:hypothetical protein F3Y22_tig00110206pilonHSYRG00436 [Hibiscus syriacus]|uniref:C3H1-type domain-containing protein n=1 Tax=Hibiscus syriacus TaxID=106335 RepID=A0A6A3B9N1_HIBSY|nr:hypothetical protein F3Y22_tig00110206pilonHSYRG00436 [Hibiscus syriacus]